MNWKCLAVVLFLMVVYPGFAEPNPADDIESDKVNLKNLEKPLLGGDVAEKQNGSGDLRLQEFVDKGKGLFSDPKLGTAGRACITCHKDPTVDLGGKIQTYPKFSKVAKTIINDVCQVNLCLTKPMKGQALNHDDERMTALIAFLKSLASAE